MRLTADQIREMAPDVGSAKAGASLAAAKHWTDLGRDDAALWGLCKGSAVYQVKIDLSDLGYHCSCPSRKFPCKHVLGILLLTSSSDEAAPAATIPSWASDWLARRQESKEKKAAKAETPKKAVDQAAQAERAANRMARIVDGLDRLDLWLDDFMRRGVAGIEAEGAAPWREQSRRLVDAQAPGLASRVSLIGEIPGSSADWPRRLVAEAGKLRLFTEAFRRLDRLDGSLQAELRQTVGLVATAEDLAREGERVSDSWIVGGQTVEDSDRVRTQRSWLFGRESGRRALMLQFAPGQQPFAEIVAPGTERRGELVFYPGAARQRAKFLSAGEGALDAVTARWPGFDSIERFLDSVADDLARYPWSDAFGATLRDVTFVPVGAAWFVRDEAGEALPLARGDRRRVLARTGGAPFDLVGEWNGREFRPLGYFFDGAYRLV